MMGSTEVIAQWGKKSYKSISRNLRVRTQVRPYELPERKHSPHTKD